jgi:RimJ/RimL family protein N-acetyltransferase
MPEVTRFQDWAPQSIDDAEEYISGATKISFDQPGTWFQLALRDSACGDLVGDIGLHFLDDGVDEVEIGFTVSPAHQKQGLATEALQTVLEYLFADLKKHRVVASVDPHNQASCHLLQKLGFRKEGHFKESLLVNGTWVDDVRFGMLRSEWV